ncbi:hypothetical protein ABMA27_010830 [Loxostege sticticalis]|uniref:Mediator of RNA polymerase II transcription subunit 16 n=1 Tax=Loxostege sticticalis TaxID=481309 RepID=A0ABR3H2D1_LOXSC
MELVYSMRRKPLKCEPPHFESSTDSEVVRPICTISSSNIIAFSSPTELSDVDGDTWGGHVYVCDLDTPWDSHKVTSTAHPVSALEWDSEGKQILVATTSGEVSVFGQKEYLLNDWTCLYSASFPGEHIIKAAFFHNGRRIVACEKKPDAPITDKFQMLRSTPTLKGFGGVACEGAAIITATGLVGALTPPAEGTRALSVTESLRAAREYVTAASIAHKNGNLLIAAVCRSASVWCVRVCAACVSRAPPARPAPPAPPHLALQPAPALYLPDAHVRAPASITWCLREDSDSLLVAGSTLTLWKLTERSHPVHKLFSKGALQGSTTPGGGPKPSADCFNTVVWQQTAVWPIEGGENAVQVASTKLPLSPPYAVLATPKALHLVQRDNHHYICSRPVIAGAGAVAVAAGGGSPPKKPKYGPGALPSGSPCAMVSSVEMSQLGGVCVCVDTHACLHVFRLQLWPDIPSPMAHATLACNLLEYSMVTGYDCLDLLMTLKPNIVEPVYERLTETFQRQSAPFQQYYYHSWLKLRIALCRMVGSLSHSVMWLTCTQMLHAACASAHSAYRTPDKDKLDDHHEQTLIALEAKPESLGDVSALQALRRPLQRALDIALTALLSLNQHQGMQQHGYDILSDPTAVTLLRKLVVLARASGRGGEALSRPLARIQAAGPKHDLLQEEWLTLNAGMTAPRVWEALPRCSVSAPHEKPYPLYVSIGRVM